MNSAIELLRQGRTQELWRNYCGFIDLSIGEFMEIQRRLLMEQIELFSKCELGKKIMHDASIKSVEEFREHVPLTTYEDYVPELIEKREDVLPEKPIFWQRTSGRSEGYPQKWIPITRRFDEVIRRNTLAILIISSCSKRYDITLKENDKFLFGMAAPPYATGYMGVGLAEEFPFDFIPPLDKAIAMPFQDRMKEGFTMALSQGLNYFAGITGVLVAVGEQFSQRSSGTGISSTLLAPRAIFRLAKALLRSKLAKRSILPQDIWSVKGMVAGGTDTSVFRERVKDLWGKYPLELFGCTEVSTVAVQMWDYKGLTFFPNACFLEFIPEQELAKEKKDPHYRPHTVCLDEVATGNKYELVITNFYGGALARYRMNDQFLVVSPRNEELNIDLPQVVFDCRLDDMIDIAGFACLTEKTIWQAIENSGIKYVEWTARKEVEGKPILSLYLELKNKEERSIEEIKVAVHASLKKMDESYAELESILGLDPLKITLLPKGTFQAYMKRQQASGADLAHLKPKHTNAREHIIEQLLHG